MSNFSVFFNVKFLHREGGAHNVTIAFPPPTPPPFKVPGSVLKAHAFVRSPSRNGTNEKSCLIRGVASYDGYV